MSAFDQLVDELSGGVKAATAKPRHTLAKALAEVDSLVKSHDAMLKAMPKAPPSPRKTLNQVRAAVDAGIAEGRLSADDVARLEVGMNAFAQKHRL